MISLYIDESNVHEQMLLFFIKISTFNWQERFRVVSYAQVLERHAQAQGECNSYIESMPCCFCSSTLQLSSPCMRQRKICTYSTYEFMIGVTWAVGW